MAASDADFSTEMQIKRRGVDFNAGEYTFCKGSATANPRLRRPFPLTNTSEPTFATEFNETFVSCAALA
jgi:hypothetical protein